MKSVDVKKILAFNWMTFLPFTRVQVIMLGPGLPFTRMGCFVATWAEITFTRIKIFLGAKAGVFIY